MVVGYRIVGETAELLIPSKGQMFTVLVDSGDLGRVLQFSMAWNITHQTRTKYVGTSVRRSGGARTTLTLHRLIVRVPDEMVVDHWQTHDGLDNRRCNLRVATNQQNICNRRGPDRDSTSGIRGVTWHKGAKKWQSHAELHGKSHHLKLHDTLDAAEDAVIEFWKPHGIVIQKTQRQDIERAA